MWNDPALIRRNRAPAGFNIPHNLQVAAVYALPFGHGSDTIANQVIRDWQVNSIFSVNQNRQFTVTASGGTLNARENAQTADQVGALRKLEGIGVGDPYYDPASFAQPTRVAGVDCTNLDCFGSTGRNLLRGPTWVNLDFSVFRTFTLNEDFGLEFRTEFLNLTNTPHFSNPNGSVASSEFMQITSTSQNAPNRVVRFGLKLKW